MDKSGTCTTANISTRTNAVFPIGGMSAITYTPTAPACGNQVVGNGTYNVFTGVNTISFTFRARACYPLI